MLIVADAEVKYASQWISANHFDLCSSADGSSSR